MIFGMLYDPLPDAEFILDRFREIKKKLHLIYKKKKYFVEGDLEKYFKNKEIIWTPPSYEVKKIKKNEKITMKNCDKFNWQYKKDENFTFHLMPMFGVAFRCYSLNFPGFEAVMEFRKEDKNIVLRTQSDDTSIKSTRLAKYLEKNYKFYNPT
jgi:hypothetical protein